MHGRVPVSREGAGIGIAGSIMKIEGINPASTSATCNRVIAQTGLEEEDIRQSLAYAAWRVEEIEVPPPAV